MLVHLGGDYYWEIIDKFGANKALLRSKKTCNPKEAMTIDMTGFNDWLYDNIETLDGNSDAQNRIIYCMEKWGQSNYIIEREGKIIFS